MTTYLVWKYSRELLAPSATKTWQNGDGSSGFAFDPLKSPALRFPNFNFLRHDDFGLRGLASYLQMFLNQEDDLATLTEDHEEVVDGVKTRKHPLSVDELAFLYANVGV